mgnify:CR=1 FL=1
METHEFWKRVQKLCKENGITQRELSERIGYGARNLEIKIARHSQPKITEIASISKVFSVSCDYLVNGFENHDTNQISLTDKKLLQMLSELNSAEQNTVRTLIKILYEQK